ncbi:putative branched-subunit amino acid permease [Aliiruegeria haliotis]|uniref:Putative branched-subunit amino acid permease n=1 Tax=Aliiruegeria haliotis TaxID=1280846 RepID=A0A2T0RT85_9RHOB|nr:AzlC family ABC transporter permease [Aliiruegeria haliotis]PRY24347.1 putative branched-subunit amino acid permease [Aliiruegeria haliotis]
MNFTTPLAAFLSGMRSSAPFLIVVVPFGFLFGVIATEAGLGIREIMGFTVLVIAGAAQITAVQMMQDNAPALIVLASALAVNLRMAMYSASLVPYLGAAPMWQRMAMAYLMFDQNYALSMVKFEECPDIPLSQRVAYYMGAVSLVAPCWITFTYLGAVVGGQIPPEIALDFAVPITFIAVVAPALRTLPHVVAAFVASVLGLVLAGLPYNTGMLVAAAVALVCAAELERRLTAGKTRRAVG